MRKMIHIALAALMTASAAVPVMTTSAEARRYRGAAIAGGVILGAAALAIIANSNRANAGEYRPRRSSWQDRCNRWYNRCQDGSNYYCEKFETQGCSE